MKCVGGEWGRLYQLRLLCICRSPALLLPWPPQCSSLPLGLWHVRPLGAKGAALGHRCPTCGRTLGPWCRGGYQAVIADGEGHCNTSYFNEERKLSNHLPWKKGRLPPGSKSCTKEIGDVCEVNQHKNYQTDEECRPSWSGRFVITVQPFVPSQGPGPVSPILCILWCF